MCIIYLVTSFTVGGVSVADVSQMLAAAMLLLIYGLKKWSFVVPLYGITLMQSFLSLICWLKLQTLLWLDAAKDQFILTFRSYVLSKQRSDSNKLDNSVNLDDK
jgi:hypothetical protein